MSVSDTRGTVQIPPGAAGADTRAGYVTLVGAPNAGKSTLLNALVGENLSIVTPKAQTTWQRVTGIHTQDGVQMIFLDTPGLLDARDLLQRSMLAAALEAVGEADVVLLVLDATRNPESGERDRIRRALSESGVPLIAAVNKVDVAAPGAADGWEEWARDELGARTHRISALRGTGLDELRRDLRRALPPGPFLYPEDDIASEPVRFFVAEMVRETIFERFRQEIPYSVWCHVEEFREAQDPIYIHVDVFVERDSQKQILIGKAGRAIREVGRSAREKIESFLGARVYLDLWVKTLPKWRRRRNELRRLGFSVPSDEQTASA